MQNNTFTNNNNNNRIYSWYQTDLCGMIVRQNDIILIRWIILVSIISAYYQLSSLYYKMKWQTNFVKNYFTLFLVLLSVSLSVRAAIT